MSTGPASLQPTFHGHVATTRDALILFEACLSGQLHHVPRRPHDRERPNLIRSGCVFIYEENASGIKRWTDGVPWSPSRILGNFLVYRELLKPFPPGEKKRATKRTKRTASAKPGEPYPRPTAGGTANSSGAGAGATGAAGGSSNGGATGASTAAGGAPTAGGAGSESATGPPSSAGLSPSSPRTPNATVAAATPAVTPAPAPVQAPAASNPSLANTPAAPPQASPVAATVPAPSATPTQTPAATPTQSATPTFKTETFDRETERALIGSLVDSYGFREGGLVKKTMSVNLNGVHHHLVSYYKVEDVLNRSLVPPSQDPTLRLIKPRAELTSRQNFRAPLDEWDDGFDPNAEQRTAYDMYDRRAVAMSGPHGYPVQHHGGHHGAPPGGMAYQAVEHMQYPGAPQHHMAGPPHYAMAGPHPQGPHPPGPPGAPPSTQAYYGHPMPAQPHIKSEEYAYASAYQQRYDAHGHSIDPSHAAQAERAPPPGQPMGYVPEQQQQPPSQQPPPQPQHQQQQQPGPMNGAESANGEGKPPSEGYAGRPFAGPAPRPDAVPPGQYQMQEARWAPGTQPAPGTAPPGYSPAGRGAGYWPMQGNVGVGHPQYSGPPGSQWSHPSA